jgi:hypothetical protein
MFFKMNMRIPEFYDAINNPPIYDIYREENPLLTKGSELLAAQIVLKEMRDNDIIEVVVDPGIFSSYTANGADMKVEAEIALRHIECRKRKSTGDEGRPLNAGA